MAGLQLLSDQAHNQRVRGVETDAERFRRRLPVAQHGPHHRGLVRRVRGAKEVAQLVDQDLQPLRLADLSRRFADEDVRGQCPVRAAQVFLAADPFVLGGETDSHPRRRGPHLLGEVQERLVEDVDGGVRGPMAHRDDLEAHAAVVLEDVRGLGKTLADALFPGGLETRVGRVDVDRHGDFVEARGQRRLVDRRRHRSGRNRCGGGRRLAGLGLVVHAGQLQVGQFQHAAARGEVIDRIDAQLETLGVRPLAHGERHRRSGRDRSDVAGHNHLAVGAAVGLADLVSDFGGCPVLQHDHAGAALRAASAASAQQAIVSKIRFIDIIFLLCLLIPPLASRRTGQGSIRRLRGYHL